MVVDCFRNNIGLSNNCLYTKSKGSNMNLDHRRQILEMVPKDVRTVLDVGSDGNLFKNWKVTTIDNHDADIIMDLNQTQELPLENNSADLVVLSQILEHLGNINKITKEAHRVSRKYILIGFPNEFTIDLRIKYMMGIAPYKNGYDPFGHKHVYDLETIDKVIQDFFIGEHIHKRHIFGVSGGRFLPKKFRNFLVKISPKFFAKEVYYLLRLDK